MTSEVIDLILNQKKANLMDKNARKASKLRHQPSNIVDDLIGYLISFKDKEKMSISKNNKLALSMGILCFQGFGIRIFAGVMEGAIVLWLMVLVMLLWRYVKRVPLSYWGKMIGIIVLYCAFSMIKGVSIMPFLIIAWLSAAVVLTPYYLRQADFVHTMRRLTRFCMYYSLFHIPIMIFFKDNLTTTSFGMYPKTFLFLFYFNGQEGFAGMNRIQGFCWEPSCWNLLLDLNLIFALFFKEKKAIIVASVVAIISIMSTTGLVVMTAIFGIYYLLNMKLKKAIQSAFFLLLFAVFVGPIVYNNVSEKLESGSGNARVGDFAIATAVMHRHPWIGVDTENLTKNMLVMNARENAWTSEGDKEGYMEQGMVNSFAALFVEWGIPITLLIFYLMFKMPLINDKKLKLLYIVAVLCVLMGSPISRTGFFYMYVLSTILLPKSNAKVNIIMSKSNALI